MIVAVERYWTQWTGVWARKRRSPSDLNVSLKTVLKSPANAQSQHSFRRADNFRLCPNGRSTDRLHCALSTREKQSSKKSRGQWKKITSGPSELTSFGLSTSSARYTSTKKKNLAWSVNKTFPIFRPRDPQHLRGSSRHLGWRKTSFDRVFDRK